MSLSPIDITILPYSLLVNNVPVINPDTYANFIFDGNVNNTSLLTRLEYDFTPLK